MKKLLYSILFITLFGCSDSEIPCEPFPILSISDVTDLTDVSATISGSIIPPTCEATVTSQGFVYSKTTLPKTNDFVIEKADVNISATLNNLEQNTNYYIRTFFENPTGVYYSNQISFKTLVGIASLNISNAYQIRATSASVNVSIGNLGGGSVLVKGIVYGTVSNPTINDNKIEDSSTDKSFKIDMSSLTQNMTYYVKGYVTNEAGTFYSDEISFVTKDGIASVQIDMVKSITAEGAAIDSRVLSDGGSEITERGVVWALDPTPTIDNNKFISSDTENTFSNLLSNLNHLTKYYVRSYVINSIGTFYSDVSEFTTLDFDTDGDGITDSKDNCPQISNPNQEDSNGDGIGDYCDIDNLVDASDLSACQKNIYPNSPFIQINANTSNIKPGVYFNIAKARKFNGKFQRINTNANFCTYDLRFLKYFTGISEIHTATFGNYSNFSLPEPNPNLNKIDLQMHNTNKIDTDILVDGYDNLTDLSISNIYRTKSIVLKNLPKIQRLEVSPWNDTNNIPIDLSKNVGVLINGKRYIESIKILGSVSSINIVGIITSRLETNPSQQESLEVNMKESPIGSGMYFDGYLDVKYSKIKKLKINDINFISVLRINDDLECLEVDDSNFINELLQNNDIRNQSLYGDYYYFKKTVQMSWGSYDRYYNYFIKPNITTIIGGCF
jgi:hypothetical protein